ncbi:MAG: helix-turn-helix domain-containing protein [bacterium]
MAISDKYYNYFKQGLTFEKVSKIMGVKKTTVFNHFFKYMYEYKNISQYDNFIEEQLPSKDDCLAIIKKKKNGASLGSIKYSIDENIDYEQIRLVLNLDNLDILKEFMKISSKHHRIPGWHEEKNEIKKINKEDFFSFLVPEDRFRLKIAVGEYLSHTAIKWVKEGEIIDINILNNIDRKEIAKKFLIDDGYQRIKSNSYKFTFKPTEIRLIQDIAKQIDYKIPKNYYKKLRFADQDHTVSDQDYMGIEDTPGLKYKYIENYIRDDLANNNEDINKIDLNEHIIPFIQQELREYGYVLKENINMNKNICLLIMYFLRNDEHCDQVMEYIEYAN